MPPRLVATETSAGARRRHLRSELTFAGKVHKQSEEAARRIQKSRLDWTIVRVPMLMDAPASGNLRIGWVGVDTGPRVSRTDAADFILAQLSSDAYVRQAPVISN